MTPGFSYNFKVTNVKSNLNFPLHKHSAWLNTGSRIWLNPRKHRQPPELCESLAVLQCVLLNYRNNGATLAHTLCVRLKNGCSFGRSHRNKKQHLLIRLILIPDLLLVFPSLLPPSLFTLVSTTLPWGYPPLCLLPKNYDALDHEQTLLWYFPAPPGKLPQVCLIKLFFRTIALRDHAVSHAEVLALANWKAEPFLK